MSASLPPSSTEPPLPEPLVDEFLEHVGTGRIDDGRQMNAV